MTILTNLDLNKNELQNAVIQPLAVAPQNPVEGQIYYNSSEKIIYQFNGTVWVPIGTGGSSVATSVQTSADAPQNPTEGQIYYDTGDQIIYQYNGTEWEPVGASAVTKESIGLGNVDNTSDATKKSDFTGTIANGDTGFVTGGDVYDALNEKLDLSGGSMSGNIAMGSNKVTGLAPPTNDADAATKAYVDGLIAGLGAYLDWKGAVADLASLPLTGMKKGDVYTVTEDGSEWVWTSTASTGLLADYTELGRTISLSGYLQTSGGTMSGNIAMGSNKVTNLADGTNAGDAVNLSQLQGLIKTATGTIGTSATSVGVNFSGTMIYAFAIMSGEEIVVDKAVTSNSVTFSVSQSPAAAITCTVIYV